MAKKTINLGTGPNTLDGDKVRTAFGKVNDNFDELYDLAGSGVRVVDVPASSTGSAGDLGGDLAFDNSYIYYCVENHTNGVGHIWRRVAWLGDTW